MPCSSTILPSAVTPAKSLLLESALHTLVYTQAGRRGGHGRGDLATQTQAHAFANYAKAGWGMKSTMGREWEATAQGTAHGGGPGSLPGFPSGRYCCRSRSNFQRGRVGPEEECLFGVHMSNLWDGEGDRAQRQEPLAAHLHKSGLASRPPAPGSPATTARVCVSSWSRESLASHHQESEGCEIHGCQESGEAKKAYRTIDHSFPACSCPSPSLLSHLQRRVGVMPAMRGSLKATTHVVLGPEPQSLGQCCGQPLSLFPDGLPYLRNL